MKTLAQQFEDFQSFVGKFVDAAKEFATEHMITEFVQQCAQSIIKHLPDDFSYTAKYVKANKAVKIIVDNYFYSHEDFDLDLDALIRLNTERCVFRSIRDSENDTQQKEVLEDTELSSSKIELTNQGSLIEVQKESSLKEDIYADLNLSSEILEDLNLIYELNEIKGGFLDVSTLKKVEMCNGCYDDYYYNISGITFSVKTDLTFGQIAAIGAYIERRNSLNKHK